MYFPIFACQAKIPQYTDFRNEQTFKSYQIFLLQIGLPGGGGEYDVQEGFGWSNGVLLHFLSKHPDLSNDAFATQRNGPNLNNNKFKQQQTDTRFVGLWKIF